MAVAQVVSVFALPHIQGWCASNLMRRTNLTCNINLHAARGPIFRVDKQVARHSHPSHPADCSTCSAHEHTHGNMLSPCCVRCHAACHAVRNRYNRLKKPEWTPPKWAFGPTWAVMYAAQGYAGWRVLHQVPAAG